MCVCPVKMEIVMEICLAGYCNHIDSLTKNKAYIGNGASSPPVMAAMVPSEKVVTMAKSKAATGELSTAGNCRAVNMEPEIRAASTRRTVCSRCCNAKQCELTCLYKFSKEGGKGCSGVDVVHLPGCKRCQL